MAEDKSKIGLFWAPKVPLLTGGRRNTAGALESLPRVSTWKNQNELVEGLFVPPRDPRKLNKLLRKDIKDTSGKGWFDMPAQTITPDIKKDLEILKLRSAIDPKRHYKKGDIKLKTLPKYFQAKQPFYCIIGTVVESASEFFSGRLTKKERKPTIADELLSDQSFKAYRKRKVRAIDDALRPAGVDKWKMRGRQSMKRAKERRAPKHKQE